MDGVMQALPGLDRYRPGKVNEPYCWARGNGTNTIAHSSWPVFHSAAMAVQRIYPFLLYMFRPCNINLSIGYRVLSLFPNIGDVRGDFYDFPRDFRQKGRHRHRPFLPVRERPLAQIPIHHPAAHRRLAPAQACAHERDRLALPGLGHVRGQPVASLERRGRRRAPRGAGPSSRTPHRAPRDGRAPTRRPPSQGPSATDD